MTISENKGFEGGGSSYYSVNSDDEDGFVKMSRDISTELVNAIGLANRGKSYVLTTNPSTNTQNDARATTGSAINAAMVDWIGSKVGSQAPRDIVAWVTDRDLIDPDVQSLEVRVLVNRCQLDLLKTTLEVLIIAARKGQISGEELFDSLLAISSTLLVEPDKVRNAKSFADAGLIPEFLLDLPYKTRIMSLNSEIWASWGPDEQYRFIDELDAMVKLYVAILDSPDGWVQLNKGDDIDEYVYLLSLEALP